MTRITVVAKHGGPLSKVIGLVDGEVRADRSPCAMSRGTARRVRLDGAPASELAAVIAGLSAHEALVLGDLADGLPDEVRIDLKARLARAPREGTVSRSRGTFVHRAGAPGFVLLDFDAKGFPREV